VLHGVELAFLSESEKRELRERFHPRVTES
jgi:hypothetical protein